MKRPYLYNVDDVNVNVILHNQLMGSPQRRYSSAIDKDALQIMVTLTADLQMLYGGSLNNLSAIIQRLCTVQQQTLFQKGCCACDALTCKP